MVDKVDVPPLYLFLTPPFDALDAQHTRPPLGRPPIEGSGRAKPLV